MQITPANPPLVTPVDSAHALSNAPSIAYLFPDGTIFCDGPVVTLPEVGAHVVSQYIHGMNTRGYIRITTDGVGIAPGGLIARLVLSDAIIEYAHIVLSCIETTTNQYFDSVVVDTVNPAFPRAIRDTPAPAFTFDIISIGQSPISTSFAYIYHILL